MSGGTGPEFWVFLPQMRMDVPTLLRRVGDIEAAGFAGLALMDHLQPPGLPGAPMFDAVATAAAVLGATDRLRVTHLVLCAAFRHPAVLAKAVATLHHLSGGRFELGMGWGSVPAELETFGIVDEGPGARSRRLGECLVLVKALLAGETVDHHGEFYRLRGAHQSPTAVPVPLLIGGAGPQLTMPLVRAHADWWNLPTYANGRARELAGLAGAARRSVQLAVGLATPRDDPGEVAAVAQRRLGPMGGLVTGTAPEVAERLGAYAAAGFERFFLWFSDFARPEVLETFMHDVAPLVRERACRPVT